MITKEEIEAMEGLYSASTAGTWEKETQTKPILRHNIVVKNPDGTTTIICHSHSTQPKGEENPNWPADQDWIVQARISIRKLLDERKIT